MDWYGKWTGMEVGLVRIVDCVAPQIAVRHAVVPQLVVLRIVVLSLEKPPDFFPVLGFSVLKE